MDVITTTTSWAYSEKFKNNVICTKKSHLCCGLPSRPFFSGLPTKTLHAILLPPYALHAVPM
jgi:hypothetical protein